MLQRFVNTVALGRLQGVIIQAQFIERDLGTVIYNIGAFANVPQYGRIQFGSEPGCIHRLQGVFKTRAIGINRLKFHEPLTGCHVIVFIGAVNTQKVLGGRIAVDTFRHGPGMVQHLLLGEARVHSIHQKTFPFTDAGEHLSNKIGIVPVVII